MMTAEQVIAEIKALPPKGREEVLRFTRALDTGSRLSGAHLEALAEKLVSSSDEEESARLKDELTKGFYNVPRSW